MSMKPIFEKPLFWYLSAILYFGAFLVVTFIAWQEHTRFNILHLINEHEPVGGTKANLEREYKFGILDFSPDKTAQILKAISESLESFVVMPSLKAPKLTDSRYQLRKSETPFLFLDFYFDTSDFALDKLNLVYRLRYRWRSVPDFVRFMNGGRNSQDLPIRCELQCKFHRRELSDGYSEAYETRFEFRTDSNPFSQFYPAPASPWPFSKYISFAQQGFFDGLIMSPAKDCAQTLYLGLRQKAVKLLPQIAILDIRTRYHVLLKTPWGTGPMPDDTFIVTMDNFWYSTNFDLLFKEIHLGRKKRLYHFRNLFSNLGAELEVEFERNVAAGVGNVARSSVETNIESFTGDLNTLSKKLVGDLKSRGIVLSGVNVSKIKQVRAATAPKKD